MCSIKSNKISFPLALYAADGGTVELEFITPFSNFSPVAGREIPHSDARVIDEKC